MKKLIIILILILTLTIPVLSEARMNMGIVGGGVSSVTALPCTGSNTFVGAPGAWESFEYGADDTCCSDLTVTDTDGKINTQDTTLAVCGTYGVSFLVSDDTNTDNYISADMGAGEDAAFRSVFYFRFSAFPDWKCVNLFYVGGSSSGTSSSNMREQICQAGAGYFIKAEGASEDTSAGGTVAANTTYRMEIDYIKNNTTTTKIYNAANSVIDTLVSTAANNTSRYIVIGPVTYDSGYTGTIYYDTIQYHSAGSADLGPVDCTP